LRDVAQQSGRLSRSILGFCFALIGLIEFFKLQPYSIERIDFLVKIHQTPKTLIRKKRSSGEKSAR
jgi:hypothetical protein